ncbi:CUB and sushi domain-containing protein 2 [Lates japonicus]|uniref:CUB and sushi domain-containing protein 2 n=1 Tax=Lates japonicus TaxID=270547 RepID=A0AAD3NE23_LATJO|nr:CUB and sushi domain-containing protein 2 [Lates japonicus]
MENILGVLSKRDDLISPTNPERHGKHCNFTYWQTPGTSSTQSPIRQENEFGSDGTEDENRRRGRNGVTHSTGFQHLPCPVPVSSLRLYSSCGGAKYSVVFSQFAFFQTALSDIVEVHDGGGLGIPRCSSSLSGAHTQDQCHRLQLGPRLMAPLWATLLLGAVIKT